MKFVLYFILILISVINVNAEITLFKETFNIDETIQAEISIKNSLEEITADKIKILKGNIETNTGVIITKINENYFVYFKINEEGQYKLKINNIKLLEDNVLKQKSFEKEFSIVKKENLIEITPNFIIFSQEGKTFFKVLVKNKGHVNANITIEKNNLTKVSETDFPLNINSEKSVFITINGLKEKTVLKIKNNEEIYYLPVYFTNNKKENIVFYTFDRDNKVYLANFEKEIQPGKYAEGKLFLENKNENLSNLKLSLEGDINKIMRLGFDKIEILESGKSLELLLIINNFYNEGLFEGDLIISNNDLKIKIPISINILSQTKEVKTQKIEENKTLETNHGQIENPVEIKKIDKKNLSYILISLIVIIFILLYGILYLRSGKNK